MFVLLYIYHHDKLDERCKKESEFNKIVQRGNRIHVRHISSYYFFEAFTCKDDGEELEGYKEVVNFKEFYSLQKIIFKSFMKNCHDKIYIQWDILIQSHSVTSSSFISHWFSTLAAPLKRLFVFFQYLSNAFSIFRISFSVLKYSTEYCNSVNSTIDC